MLTHEERDALFECFDLSGMPDKKLYDGKAREDWYTVEELQRKIDDANKVIEADNG